MNSDRYLFCSGAREGVYHSFVLYTREQAAALTYRTPDNDKPPLLPEHSYPLVLRIALEDAQLTNVNREFREILLAAKPEDGKLVLGLPPPYDPPERIRSGFHAMVELHRYYNQWASPQKDLYRNARAMEDKQFASELVAHETITGLAKDFPPIQVANEAEGLIEFFFCPSHDMLARLNKGMVFNGKDGKPFEIKLLSDEDYRTLGDLFERYGIKRTAVLREVDRRRLGAGSESPEKK